MFISLLSIDLRYIMRRQTISNLIIRIEDKIMTKINKEVSGLVLAAFVGIFGVSNAQAQDVDLSKVKYQEYQYGMNLDVKNVISMSEKKGDCEVVPAKMVYQDSQGNIKGVKYEVLSEGCDNG